MILQKGPEKALGEELSQLPIFDEERHPQVKDEVKVTHVRAFVSAWAWGEASPEEVRQRVLQAHLLKDPQAMALFLKELVCTGHEEAAMHVVRCLGRVAHAQEQANNTGHHNDGRILKHKQAWHARLVSHLGNMGEMRVVAWVVRRMLRVGPLPDAFTCNALLSALCQAALLPQALCLLQAMRANRPAAAAAAAASRTARPSMRSLWVPGVHSHRESDESDRGHAAPVAAAAAAAVGGGGGPVVARLSKAGLGFGASSSSQPAGEEKPSTSGNGLAWGAKSQQEEDKGELGSLMVDVHARLSAGKCPPVPSVVTYNTLIGGCAVLAGDAAACELALDLLAQMEDDDIAPNVVTFNKLLEGLSRAQQWQACVHVLQHMHARGLSPCEYSYSQAIAAAARAGQCHVSGSLFLEMHTRQHPTAVAQARTYNQYIEACRQSRRWRPALKALEWMQRDGVAPDKFTFNSLIALCRQHRQPQQAMEVYAKMQEAGVAPNNFTFVEVLYACQGEGSFQQALSHFWALRSGNEDFRPDLAVYNVLLGVCQKGLLAPQAQEVWHDMLTRGLAPDETSYNLLISTLGKAKQAGEAFAKLEEMQAKRLQLQLETYNVLIDVCANAGDYWRALEVVGWMKRDGVGADVVTYNTLLKACHRSAQGMAAVSVFQQLLHAGLQPDATTYVGYLSALEVCSLGKQALEAYRKMKADELHTCPLMPFFITKILGACATGGGHLDDALEVYGEMLENGLKPTAHTFLALLRAFEIEGRWRQALRTLEDYRAALAQGAVETHVAVQDEVGKSPASGAKEPSNEAYNMVIVACDNGGASLEAYNVLNLMHARGLTPTMATYALVVKALQTGGFWNEAMEIYNKIPIRPLLHFNS
eukprot:jgi/Mesen1/1137/ME000123S00310